MFPLAFDAGTAALERGGALAGGMLQAISHATAKAAMFMAAGLIYKALGHDRIAEFAGIGRALPVSVLTFALAGLALMGLPPSGAFAAKKLLLDAAGASGQWWWEVVLDVGGLLTASYVVLVLAHALTAAPEPIKPRAPVSRLAETAALALAICSSGWARRSAGARRVAESARDEFGSWVSAACSRSPRPSPRPETLRRGHTGRCAPTECCGNGRSRGSR
jgi:formate hydrogenlyase subunit 3/multisubunit Na+/H+ antiporter MnhD subunit